MYGLLQIKTQDLTVCSYFFMISIEFRNAYAIVT